MISKPLSKSEPIRIGLVGFGLHAQGELIPAIRQAEDFELSIVYDCSEKARGAATASGLKVAESIEAFWECPQLNAVLVASSNESHVEYGLMAAHWGKHILCEKPLALEHADAVQLCEAVELAQVVGHVNYGLPFNDSFQRVQEIVESELGSVQHLWIRTSRGFGNWLNGARHQVVANPYPSGGWTKHHLCHALSAAMVIMNKPVNSVYYRTQKSSVECPSEELIHAFLTFDDGSTAYINDGTTIGGFQDAGIVGLNGDLRLIDNRITYVKNGEPAKSGRPGILDKVLFDEPISSRFSSKPSAVVLRNFANAIHGNADRGFSFQMASEQIEIIDALKRSESLGQAVFVREPLAAQVLPT